MKEFEQFKEWLKAMHSYEFFISLIGPFANPRNFYDQYGENLFLVASKQATEERFMLNVVD